MLNFLGSMHARIRNDHAAMLAGVHLILPQFLGVPGRSRCPVVIPSVLLQIHRSSVILAVLKAEWVHGCGLHRRAGILEPRAHSSCSLVAVTRHMLSGSRPSMFARKLIF